MESKQLITFVRDNNKFYKSFYSSIKTNNLKDMPFINKEKLLKIFKGFRTDLISKDVKEGIFIRVTSGTSNMMGMFNHSDSEIEASANRYKDIAWYLWMNGRDRVCVIHNYSLSYIFVRHMLKCGCEVSLGNPYDLQYTVEHIVKTKSNIIRTSPTLALKLAPLLKERGHEVDFWILAGAGLSTVVENKIKQQTQGHTNIIMQYGMAETLNSMYQPHGAYGNDFCLYTNGDFIYEFLDEDGNDVKGKNPGELVITRLSKDNPIIRYKTGDLFIKTGRVIDGHSVYKIIGRIGDQIKINGVVVFKDKIETAINSIRHLITGHYQLCFSDAEFNGIVKSILTLYVTPLEHTQKTQHEIKIIFERTFEVSENYTWEDGFMDNVFAPLRVEFKTFDEINKIREIVDNRLENEK